MSPSIVGELVCYLDQSKTWMDPILDILAGTPEEVQKYTKEQRREASHYTLIDWELFRQGFTPPLHRCVTLDEYEGVMSEVHEGICVSHIRGRLPTNKVLRAGFYRPTLRRDCLEYVKRYEKCQVFPDLPKAPLKQLATIIEPWQFAM